MDTFFEQIIEMRKTLKDYIILALIWFLAISISAFLFVFLFGIIGPILCLLVIGICYAAYKLSMNFFIEYEYIITNGTLDIDKIIAKSTRKRIVSIEIASVDSVERYNKTQKNQSNVGNTVIACNSDDSNAYAMTLSKKSGGTRCIVFAPNDKIKSAVTKYLPKYISNSAFK